MPPQAKTDAPADAPTAVNKEQLAKLLDATVTVPGVPGKDGKKPQPVTRKATAADILSFAVNGGTASVVTIDGRKHRVELR